MESLKKITQFLNSYLKVHNVKDSSWNGLQFEGAQQVKKIVFAVDAGAETFERTVAEHAEMVVVHHGQFWSQQDPYFYRLKQKKARYTLQEQPIVICKPPSLDMHKTVGNNAMLIRLIGARIKGSFALYEGQNISYTAVFKKPVLLSTIEKRLNSALNTECIVLPFGAKKIRTVGVVSGSCSHSHVNEAITLGLDLFITGENKDIYHLAKDAPITIIFAGHHASETVGVKALSELVRKKLKVKTVFVDIPTGL